MELSSLLEVISSGWLNLTATDEWYGKHIHKAVSQSL